MGNQQNAVPAPSEKRAGAAKRFFRRVGRFLELEADGIAERTRTPADRQAVALERIAAIAVAQNALFGVNAEATDKTTRSHWVLSGSYSKDWPIIQRLFAAVDLLAQENARLHRDLQWQQIWYGPEHGWDEESYSSN
ncbi:hypothetical protein LCGC14_1991080 [marine sediment metagenome]|uniref:Uncharacterized protein n=1 Tax=marine sediment metagenome TaxID=412755 RepID=A0A0F9FU59_9ZZZZ